MTALYIILTFLVGFMLSLTLIAKRGSAMERNQNLVTIKRLREDAQDLIGEADAEPSEYKAQKLRKRADQMLKYASALEKTL